MRELRLQVFLRRSVEVEILLECAAPHGVRFRRLLAVRLVPYLPVVDLPLESVRPAFGVVAHDPFAYLRPLEVVLRREYLARSEINDIVFDRHPKTEVRCNSVCDQCMQQVVGECERVRRGILWISVEVLEEIWNVYVYSLPRHRATNVVKTRIWNVSVPEAREQLVVSAKERRLAYAMHRLDLICSPREIN